MVGNRKINQRATRMPKLPKLALFMLMTLATASIAFGLSGRRSFSNSPLLDLLIIHARVEAPEIEADAVGIAGTRLISLGTTDELLPQCHSQCRVVDASGK